MAARARTAPLPRLVAIDCETTGLGRDDRIVEFAAVTLDPLTWEPANEYDTLINPEREEGARRLRGVTPSMLDEAPTFAEAAPALASRLRGVILIAHNLAFDARMLACEFGRLGVSFDAGAGLCTYRATRERLATACRRRGIELPGRWHRALTDARATAALAREVLDRGRDGPLAAAGGRLPPLQLRLDGAPIGFGTAQVGRVPRAPVREA